MYYSPATLAVLLASYSSIILAMPAAPQSPNPSLNKRGITPSRFQCNYKPLGDIDPNGIKECADRLRQKGGKCTTPTGKGVCIRVACNNTTGVWMCNSDTSDGPNTQQCTDVANFAWLGTAEDDQSVQDALNQCYVGGEYYVHDQPAIAFDESGDWTVITAPANCNVPASKGPTEQ